MSNYIPVTGVSLSITDSSIRLVRTTNIFITATVYPTNATNKGLRWSSSEPNFVSLYDPANYYNSPDDFVSETIQISALQPGTSVVTVTTDDGNISASLTVEVFGVTLTINPMISTIGFAGKPIDIYATITVPNGNFSTIWWSSTDSAAAIVTRFGTLVSSSPSTTTIRGNIVGNQNGSTTIVVESYLYVGHKEVGLTVTTPVQSVLMNVGNIRLQNGNTFQAIPTIYPSTATNKDVSWSSSSNEIATVNSSGLITAVSTGTATITVNTADGDKTNSLIASVLSLNVPVQSVSLNVGNIKLENGNTFQAIPTISPSFATNKDVSWSSSSNEIATVDTSGVITAVSTGTAIISVNTVDGNKTNSLIASVLSQAVPVQSVLLNVANVKLQNGNTFQAIPTIYPTSATNKNVTWSSSSNEIATVNTSGLITAVSTGRATITVNTADGNKKNSLSASITSQAVPVQRVSLNIGNVRLENGNTIQAIPTIYPSTATNKNITWSSSSDEIATVNTNGVITAVSTGRATITVNTADGNKKASLMASILTQVTGVTINGGSALELTPWPEIKWLKLNRGNTTTLTASVSPPNASNLAVRWASFNTRVATVSNSGVVTAVSVGETVIIVTTVSGGLSYQCWTKVYQVGELIR